VLRKLQAVENALDRNTKVVIPANTELVNIIGDMAGILPLRRTPEGEAVGTASKTAV